MNGLAALRFAFLNQRASDVQPSVRVLGLGFGDLAECILGAFQIALQQQPDAPVVPTLAVGLRDHGLPYGWRLAELQLGFRVRQRHDGQVRDLALNFARHIRRYVAYVEKVFQAVVIGAQQSRILAGLRVVRHKQIACSSARTCDSSAWRLE